MKNIITCVLLAVLVGLTGCAISHGPATSNNLTGSNVTATQNVSQPESNVRLWHNDDIFFVPAGVMVYLQGFPGPAFNPLAPVQQNSTFVQAFNGMVSVNSFRAY